MKISQLSDTAGRLSNDMQLLKYSWPSDEHS